MTHASVSSKEREKLGISDTLVRSYNNGKLDLVAVCTYLNDVSYVCHSQKF